MPDGRHCPECGEDIGYWAVAWGLFSIRCPHCRGRLRYSQTPRMNGVTTAGALACVVLGLGPAVVASMLLFRTAGILAAILGGFAAWIASAFGLGLVLQFGLAPVLRRTQRLTPADAPEDEPD